MTRLMARLAGVDGCKGGWVAVEGQPGGKAVSCRRVARLTELLASTPDIIAVDVPIGLLDTGARKCDREARRILGPRRNSVFPAPLRPMLQANSHAEASAIRSQIEHKRVSIQAWGIIPKIREADELLTENPSRQEMVREVHPEVSFYFMNFERPMAHAKKKAAGKDERLALLRKSYGELIDDILDERANLGCEYDDIIDAFAAFWSAERVACDEAVVIPPSPPTDTYGLRMEMVA